MLLSRRPCPALAPFVQRLWCSRSEPQLAAARERVLPTGTMHLVLRLEGGPLRCFEDELTEHAIELGSSLVGGARAQHYVRDVSQLACSVGAQLHAGAAPCLLGVPATELAGRHVSLEDLWGGSVRTLHERLLSLKEPSARLALFEHALCERLPRVRGMHPAVAESLARMRMRAPSACAVRDLVQDSGYSHRRFISLFEQAVGLTPKVFMRVRRFQQLLARCEAHPELAWAELALSAGYTDQAHFNREFRSFTGLTPGRYRALPTRARNHVPIAAQFQFRTRPAPGHTSG
jgi:AraC-like DNA-binding protein